MQFPFGQGELEMDSNGLFENFFRTIKGYRPGIKTLAIRLGLNEWRLYKFLSPESWESFPISLLIPLTETTKNHTLLEALAREAGFGIFRIPKKGIAGAFQDSTEFQAVLFETANKYHAFYKNLLDRIDPSDREEIENARRVTDEALETIRKGMAALAKAEHQVVKYRHRQTDLFCDGGAEDGEDE